MIAPIQKVVVIGSGNVGYHLARRLHGVGVGVTQVFSRTESKARQLAKEISSDFTTDLTKIKTTADLYILAVHDSAIGEVETILFQRLPKTALVVHTSGVTAKSVFQQFERHGIFYPLQTFSVNRMVDFEQIPVCVDANHPNDIDALQVLGKRISQNVHRISDEQRAILHVAAVIVNNFANHLFRLGKEIVEEHAIPFDLLRPLILETAAKVQANSPKMMQTGPAVRADESTIQRHLDFLSYDPQLQALYEQLTRAIQKK